MNIFGENRDAESTKIAANFTLNKIHGEIESCQL